LEEHIPISLSNCIYKIISIIISRRIKEILPKSISQEKFGFLEGRQIHEAIGVSQKAMHIIKTHKIKGAVLKIDLSKAYDRVNSIFLRMLLTHLGFVLPFINWVMRCISSVSFAVLINSVASPFFIAKRGLGKGCPLSLLLFLVVEERLSRALSEEKNSITFTGIPLTHLLSLTHFVFVDEVLIFSSGLRGDAEKLSIILDHFSRATGMQINSSKCTLSTHLMDM